MRGCLFLIPALAQGLEFGEQLRAPCLYSGKLLLDFFEITLDIIVHGAPP
jgi:hypothetical protein